MPACTPKYATLSNTIVHASYSAVCDRTALLNIVSRNPLATTQCGHLIHIRMRTSWANPGIKRIHCRQRALRPQQCRRARTRYAVDRAQRARRAQVAARSARFATSSTRGRAGRTRPRARPAHQRADDGGGRARDRRVPALDPRRSHGHSAEIPFAATSRERRVVAQLGGECPSGTYGGASAHVVDRVLDGVVPRPQDIRDPLRSRLAAGNDTKVGLADRWQRSLGHAACRANGVPLRLASASS